MEDQTSVPSPRKVYIPPGKTTDMSKWDKADVLRWMSYFLHVETHPKVYDEFRKLPIDGDVLLQMVRFKPHHMTFKITQEEMDLLLTYAEAVIACDGLGIKPDPEEFMEEE